MNNNLIENETKVFYTINAGNNTVVSNAKFYSGSVKSVEISRTANQAEIYTDMQTASKIATYIDGKIIKHTRTRVVTEITEEVKTNE